VRSCRSFTPPPRPAVSPTRVSSSGCRNRRWSRQVSALEQELNVPRFHRHARGLILTEQGDLLYRTAHDVFMKLEAARTKLTDSREKPTAPRLGERRDAHIGARHRRAGRYSMRSGSNHPKARRKVRDRRTG
jgi:DNA-binding transcriptional LysR family regulator